MTIKSLQDLNTYAQSPITYDDVRTAQVLFDRGATVDQALTISENSEFELPYGININDITQYDVAEVEYHIDLSFWSDPVSISWDFLPSHITVTRTNNTWIVSDIRSAQDWLYVREAKVLPPFGYSGVANLDAEIQYYSDNQDSTKNIAAWDITLTVTQVQYFSSTVDRTYVSNQLYSNINPTSILTDPEDFDPVWDLRIYADNTGAIAEIFSDGSAAEASWNNTTKQYVVTGDTESVNDVLSTLDIETDRYSTDFVLYFRLANNYTSDLEFQTQQYFSRDFISDQTVEAGMTTANAYIFGAFATINPQANLTSAPGKIMQLEADITATAGMTTTARADFVLQPTSVDSAAGIVPNGGYLIESGQITIEDALTATVYANGGYLLEHEATDHTATSTLQSWPFVTTPADFVFTIDQSHHLTGDIAFNPSINNTNYDVYYYGAQGAIAGGGTTGKVPDHFAPASAPGSTGSNYQRYLTAVVTPRSGYPNTGMSLDADDCLQLLQINQWGTMSFYAIDFGECDNLVSIDTTVGPQLDFKFTVTGLDQGFINVTDTNIQSQLSDFIMDNVTKLAGMIPQYSTITRYDLWDVSNVTDFSGAFAGDWGTGMRDITSYDVSSATDMTRMFQHNVDFNQDIGHWNVSSVTSFEAMFQGGDAGMGSGQYYEPHTFNQDIGSWNTGSATTMKSMFEFNTDFNQNIGSWNTANVTTMEKMFYGADSFNYSIDGWDVSSVTNMEYMFANASPGGYTNGNTPYETMSFNQNLNSWTTTALTDMNYMFYNSESFNGQIDNWDVSNVTQMFYVFANAAAFNQTLNSWDVSAVTYFNGMFQDAIAFNQSLNSWDTSSATQMGGMFARAESFNGNISSWDTSSVTYMGSMFAGSQFPTDPIMAFNGNIGSWDVSSVTNMSFMFQASDTFNQNISSWDTSSVTNMEGMFYDAVSFDQDISGWNVSSVTNSTNFDTGTSASWTSAEKPTF